MEKDLDLIKINEMAVECQSKVVEDIPKVMHYINNNRCLEVQLKAVENDAFGMQYVH